MKRRTLPRAIALALAFCTAGLTVGTVVCVAPQVAEAADPAHEVVDDVRLLLPDVAGHAPGDPVLSYVLTPPDQLVRGPGGDGS